MALSNEDEKRIRLWIRQEINKAVGSIIVAARKTNRKEVRDFAANTKFIENVLLKGVHQAEDELSGMKNRSELENYEISKNEKLPSYD